MTSSYPFSSSATHLLREDSQASSCEPSWTCADVPIGPSNAYAHTASTNDLSWSYLSDTTLTDFEQELANNYLTIEQVIDASVDVSAFYGPQPAFAPSFDAGLQMSWTPTPNVDAIPAQGTTLEDPNMQWLLPPTSSLIPPNPIVYPSFNPLANPTLGAAGAYPTIADTSIGHPPVLSVPSPHVDPALFLQVLIESFASEHQNEHSFPTPPRPIHRAATRSQKRAKSFSPYPTSPAASSSASPSPSSLRDSSPPLIPRIATRRNAAVPTAARHTPCPTPSANPWKCPYCPYVQKTRRTPDLKRHIETHTRSDSADEANWVCCGVPRGAASDLGVPQKAMTDEPFEYAGQDMVGGCRQVFSRRDALKRHLRKRKGVCFGSELAPYLRGNVVGAR
ncbi:hypothetical protein BN946_scf184298.g33 [Trametes cinnabarina]|uniref:Uncharacterized protein n=1 Tax=Pycnoporus cinnabarinus TaxID=5643 RepID=A0A060SS59_PYCCI|nr:hypothetical protein BN946_scf184298.g33 [Trametes cinnabarina]